MLHIAYFNKVKLFARKIFFPLQDNLHVVESLELPTNDPQVVYFSLIHQQFGEFLIDNPWKV